MALEFASGSGGGGGGSGTGGYASIIAASDTPSTLQAQATTVCTGTDDQTPINSVISDVAALSVGARVLMLPGTYSVSGAIDFSPLAVASANSDGKWIDWDAAATQIIAGANLTTMLNLAAPPGSQIFSKLNARFGRVDGNKATYTVTQGVYMQRFVDNHVWISELVDCSGTGFVIAQAGVTDYGCFNNFLSILKCNTHDVTGLFVSSDPNGTSIYGCQGNTVRMGQVFGNLNGVRVGSGANQNAKLNRFEIGVAEHNTASGILDTSGNNLWLINNTNSNGIFGIGSSVSGVTQRSTFIVADMDDTLDGGITAQHTVIVGGNNVYSGKYPTADPHITGQLWESSGTLHVSAG
ncbi:MAG: hypothetical protein ACRDUT_00075 [Mycobacterium sp.]